MPEPLTREQMYEAAWSKPLSSLSSSFNVSDVALAKACRKANIPIPPRGYWSKKQSERAIRPPLPPRFPGARATVEVGDYRPASYLNLDLLMAPLPTPPIFTEDLRSLRMRVINMVGKVLCPSLASRTHPVIRKLVMQDEARKAKYDSSKMPWDEPWFTAPIDKRRLKLLNALFLATQKLGCRPSISTSQFSRDNREASFKVGDIYVSIILKPIEPQKKVRGRACNITNHLALVIQTANNSSHNPRHWEDSNEQRIEDFLTDITVEILMAAEESLRTFMLDNFQWVITRRAELEDEASKKRLEAKTQAREEQQKLEQEHIERLLTQADDLRKSDIIRGYVNEMRASSVTLSIPPESIEKWSKWALEHADRIDPRLNLSFLADCNYLGRD